MQCQLACFRPLRHCHAAAWAASLLNCLVGAALQDRGYWDEDNAKLFPKTAKVFQDMDGELGAWRDGKQWHGYWPPTLCAGCHLDQPTLPLPPALSFPAAPTLEVFFARQPPGTGVKRHTDYVNFVQTTHLGLIVPEGDCWMKARRGIGAVMQGWQDKLNARCARCGL